jgi:hypothetical protein
MKQKTLTAEEMEHLFDEGDERYLAYFDLSKSARPGLEQQKVNVSLPNWMVSLLDEEADRLGVTRRAIIKLWLDEKLETISA